MIGAIAGDIIGSRFEGGAGPPAGFTLFDPLCRFTDDSVCTLAVADALMGGRDFASTLRAFVRRHPSRGYGGMFLHWALSDAPPYGSWGNGAPMRASAVGWIARDEAETMELAAAQSEVSHNHPEAIRASQAVALAIFQLRQGGCTEDVRCTISDRFGYDLTLECAMQRRGFDVTAAGTVPPAMAAALNLPDWETAVRAVVSLGGDTDTLACIAGAIAEAAYGVPDAIAAAAKDYLTPDLLAVLARFDAVVTSY